MRGEYPHCVLSGFFFAKSVLDSLSYGWHQIKIQCFVTASRALRNVKIKQFDLYVPCYIHMCKYQLIFFLILQKCSSKFSGRTVALCTNGYRFLDFSEWKTVFSWASQPLLHFLHWWQLFNTVDVMCIFMCIAYSCDNVYYNYD